MDIRDAYLIKKPEKQHVLDLFQGEWSSRMPEDSGLMKALDRSGFRNREISFDEPDHPHGPAIAIGAWQ